MADFESILRQPVAEKVLGHSLALDEDSPPFVTGTASRLDFLLRNPENVQPLAQVADAALNAFLQSNITGPPLSFNSAEVIFPKAYTQSESSVASLRKQLVQSLSVDGEAVYELTPNIELFWLAKCIRNNDAVANLEDGKRQRARTNFIHQRLLFEHSETLQQSIYADLKAVEGKFLEPSTNPETSADFLTERATIHIFYGLDGEARKDLSQAAKLRKFEFALTGRLGKRTKFQQFDLSQLVVLARSAEDDTATTDATNSNTEGDSQQTKPENLALNDDTLLESIAFKKDEKTANLPTVEDSSSLPATLATLDPANQPLLSPQDSIILLSMASSITNTSPDDGLTREETLPYALRVLDGGSSNWQIYSQALLVRSRIEGYNSRTRERGLLQLQALVDQVIADTTQGSSVEPAPSTFLPKPNAAESAPVEERLKYIHSLATPFRWTLEAELASRWIHMGGLKSALEIYERLHMWAEVALCLAATDQEKKAIAVVRKQLFQASAGGEEDEYTGPELSELPSDAPRLFCILGDMESDLAIQHYNRAWEVSKSRYARAQRSLARLYSKQRSFEQAAEAYKLSLKANRLNAATWFALGCVQIELEDYPGAATSFTQMVQLEESDAEGWSNLAVALLKMPANETAMVPASTVVLDDEDETVSSSTATTPSTTLYNNRLSALRALQRATSLRPTDARLWDNYLTVAASLPPSITPWATVILSQRRVLSLRKSESSIDVRILSRLIDHVVSNYPFPGPNDKPFSKGSLPAQLTLMLDKDIVPLITTDPELWYLVSKVSTWRRRPAAALDAEEKAWRIVINRPAIYETEAGFKTVVDATERLVNAYRELGPMEKEGLGRMEAISAEDDTSSTGRITEEEPTTTTTSAVPVAKDWKFKARSAIRSVSGKGKAYWEDSESMERLNALAEGLKRD